MHTRKSSDNGGSPGEDWYYNEYNEMVPTRLTTHEKASGLKHHTNLSPLVHKPWLSQGVNYNWIPFLPMCSMREVQRRGPYHKKQPTWSAVFSTSQYSNSIDSFSGSSLCFHYGSAPPLRKQKDWQLQLQ